MTDLIRYVVEQFAEHPELAEYKTEERGNTVTVTVYLTEDCDSARRKEIQRRNQGQDRISLDGLAVAILIRGRIFVLSLSYLCDYRG